MIVDLFLYNGERELFDVRVHELRDTVDLFVAVVANRTHQGDPQPWPVPPIPDGGITPCVMNVDLSDLDHLSRGGVGNPDYYKRERAHRDRAIDALADLPDDAVLLLSDADEIPRAEAVAAAAEFCAWEAQNVCQFMQTMYGFAIDWQHEQPWPGTTAARLGWARGIGVQAMRDARGDTCATLTLPGGWHFSWLGGPDEWRRKQWSFSHAEFLTTRNSDDWLACWREGIHSNGEVMLSVEMDDTYPALMRDPEWVCPEWWRRPRDPA